MTKKLSRIILYTLLVILLVNPLTMGLFLEFFGIASSYHSGRNDTKVTFFSSVTPKLPEDLWFDSWGLHDGGIQINDLQRKPMTIYDDRGSYQWC